MSDDGIFDDVVVEEKAPSSRSQNETQTQPDVKNLISDIFGDSDDEDEQQQTRQLPVKPANYADDEDDNIFADSDEDDTKLKGGRLQKKTTVTKSVTPASRSQLDNPDLLDSDDEDELAKAVQLAKKRKHEEKQKKLKKKSHMLEPSNKKSKSSSSPKPPKEPRAEGAEGPEVSSGDEYDSGEEVVEDADDRNFIDKDDDHADLLDEYNADNQHFEDERPDDDDAWEKNNKKAGKNANKYSSAMSSSTTSNRIQDPLSETLLGMKNPKIAEMAEMEKELYVERLQKKMDRAVIADNECVLKGEPAINKLKLVPVLIQTFNMKALQNTLLERDILCNLRDFLEPKDSKTLPALAVRTAIYEILLKINCTPDHLKRVVNEKPPIGAIIVQLRKHKAETAENKRLLKDIMDKWSRPIFAKSVDVRSNGGMTALLQDNVDVQESLRQKYAQSARERDATEFAAERGGGGGQENKQSVKLDSFMNVEAKNTTSTDYYNRARTPYSQGFLFTVQPELKSVDKTDIMEKSLGEGRMKLFKKMGLGGAKGDGLGRKVNPRAMDMKVSGTNIKA